MLQEDFDTEAVVHVDTIPPSGGRASVDPDPALLVLVRNLRPVAQRLCVARRNAVDGRTIQLHETQRAIVQDLDTDAAFVHSPVMKATERYEVRRFRLTAVRPVLDVMRIDVSAVRTPRKTAALIASVQHTAQRR